MNLSDLTIGSSMIQVEILGDIFDMYLYVPDIENPGIFFSFHGTGRNADDYRRRAIEAAEREKCIVIAPEFDYDRWRNWEYHRGGLVYDDVTQPEANWTVHKVPAMVDWARSIEGTRDEVTLFGHSAGGQFLSRVAAYATGLNVGNIIIANPSTYVLPDQSENAAYSFGGLPSNVMAETLIKQYLERPVTVYLGSEDTSTDNLTMTDEAQRQGENRLDRGLKTFAYAQQVALDNNIDFNWSLVIAQGIAHSSSGMLAAPELAIAMLTEADLNRLRDERLANIIQVSKYLTTQLEGL